MESMTAGQPVPTTGSRWLEAKSAYPDYLVAIQIGMFYEFFEGDAVITAASPFNLTVHYRQVRFNETATPLRARITAVSVFQINTFCRELADAGYRVVLIDQHCPLWTSETFVPPFSFRKEAD